MKTSHIVSYIFLVIFYWIFAFTAFAQSKNEIKGDRLMEEYAFLAATESYQKALDNDVNNSRIKLKLATCYQMLNDPENTVKWYSEIVNDDELIEPINKYQYALALTSAGDFEEAKKWFEIYGREVPDDERAEEYLDQLNNIESLYKDSSLYSIKLASFNSSFTDFSPAYFKNNIVFISSRGDGNAKYAWDNTNYLDLFISYKNALRIYDQPVPFHKNINTKFHEGPISFYENGQKLVLTRNNFEDGVLKKSSDGVTRLKLYFSSIDGEGNWSETLPFSYNSDEYSVGHPAITEDGSTMYFISDMPGGYGETDIYITHKQPGGWSKPENLGPDINTKGNEMFPFLHKGSILYFASNGHGGFGGLDIFKYDGESSEIKNLGFPINSSRDDFGFILSEDSNEGFLSSNRGSNNLVDNIYQFEILKPNLFPIETKVVDSRTNQPLANAFITWEEFSSGAHASAETDSIGIVNIPMKLRRQYTLFVKRKGYKENSEYLITKDGTEKIIIKLNPECQSVRGTVEIAGEAKDNGDILVVLTNKYTQQKDSLLISINEYYDFCVVPKVEYNLKIDKENYFATSVNFKPMDDQNIELDKFVLEEIILDKTITLDNIYYDVGKWNIRTDAAKELDRLVSLMEDNPTIEIELSSHTDSRGGDASNLNLSVKRARSAADYIVSRGIEASRIIAQGYGETKLINDCANGINCTNEEHQENRRTEFKVLKY